MFAGSRRRQTLPAQRLWILPDYRGRIDIFSKFTLMDGEMNGYVKPFISDLKVLDVKKDIKKKGGILRVVKKAVVGLFAKVVTNPRTKKIATVIPSRVM